MSEIPSIDATAKAEWNRLVEEVGGTIFHRWEWIAAYERRYPLGALKAAHHLIGRNQSGELFAMLPLFHLENDPLVRSVTSETRPDLASVLARPCLTSHSWYAFYSSVVGAQKSPFYDCFVEQALCRMDDICDRERIPYSCFTGVRADDPLCRWLDLAGYRSYSVMDNFVLRLTSRTFEAYLPTLRSANMRRNMKRYTRRLSLGGVAARWITEPTAGDAEKLHAVVRKTFARHGSLELADPIENLTSIFGQMAGLIQMLVLDDGDGQDWHAAALCFIDGNTLYACIPGQSRSEFLRPLDLRINLYGRIIQRGFELGCQRIEFGREGHQYKKRLGCVPVRTLTFLKSHGSRASDVYDCLEQSAT